MTGHSEVWKQTVVSENHEVSTHGRVRSLDQRTAVRGGGTRLLKGRALKPFWVSNNGNRQGKLVVELGRGHRFSVAELVLTTFVGPRPPGMLALHRDDIKTHNGLTNLYWGTFSDNRRDAIANGLDPAVNRTHCRNCGHELEWRNDRSQRNCPACNRRTMRRVKQRQKDARTNCPRCGAPYQGVDSLGRKCCPCPRRRQ